MSRARFVTMLLALIAVAATLGHICVLPGHVHAAPVEAHEHDAAHDDHEGTAPVDDGVHAASCEALRPGTPATSAAPAAAVLTPVFVVPREARVVRLSIAAPAPTGSPPLYIAHRSLLI